MLKGSPGSGPARALKRMRRSATVRAMGPTTPIQPNELLLGGKWPAAGIRPGGGFSAQMPQKGAGTRTEPPPSLPVPPKEQADGRAAASPPRVAPPGDGEIQGARVAPVRGLLGL